MFVLQKKNHILHVKSLILIYWFKGMYNFSSCHHFELINVVLFIFCQKLTKLHCELFSKSHARKNVCFWAYVTMNSGLEITKQNHGSVIFVKKYSIFQIKSGLFSHKNLVVFKFIFNYGGQRVLTSYHITIKVMFALEYFHWFGEKRYCWISLCTILQR